jgi:CheY-like chemotaxis protein
MAALADMTTGVADELNNAIGGVIGRIQLLREKLSDKDHQRDLALIEELITPTTDTVKRIQQFVSATQSKDFEATDLVRVVGEVVADTDCQWSEMADTRGVEVVISGCCGEAVVSGFEPDLRLLLDKLLDNAVEHSPENGTVEVALVSNEKGYQLSVSDQGSGVPSIDRDRIFYPFFTTKQQRGAGMSLAIVHGVVVRHGGAVMVSDNEAHGAIFTIAFPHQVIVEDMSEITGKIRIPAKLRVLVVDDDEQIRKVLSDMIQMDGHETTMCCDAYAALEEVANGEYDLLITDLGMPGMSGLDLAGVVHERLPGLPVAMITGWGTQLNEEEVKTKGVKRILAKPFHLKDIKALVADLVR